ncbi:MAG: Phosphopantetheine adenylyltransferase [Planctomycetes bacterium ADurb.Bin126]|nr:MAG: Phosphopantetheine adenylyltransferase [Planctomycetes bacterium ADurb.Bin126]
MTDRPPRLGLFPGTFDPITNGHLDIIRRGRGLFDQLVVAVGDNPEKHSLLNANERAAIIREVVADMDNVRVEIFTGLTVDLARRLGATAILRGLRNTTDLHFEFQVALTNRVVASIETVFVITATEWAFTSSSLIRQIARMGGDVSAMVPPQVVPYLQSRCGGGEDHALVET